MVMETAGRKPPPPFFAVPSSVMGISDDLLPFAGKCVYGILRTHGGLPAVPSDEEKQGRCNPGEDTLARELGGVSSRYVRMLITRLRNCGLISWRQTGRSNEYRVLPPSHFRPPEKNECSSRARRNKCSTQVGRGFPIRTDAEFRPGGKSPSDKKINKREAKRHEKEDFDRDLNFGDLSFYGSE